MANNSPGKNQWQTSKWHCPNCNAMTNGTKDKKGAIKATCNKCGVIAIRYMTARHHMHIDIFFPGEESPYKQDE